MTRCAALFRQAGVTLEERNRNFHRMLVASVTVEYVDTNGRVRGAQVRLLDFDEPDANDWFAVNQFTVVENKHERRPDIVLFVNGFAARRRRAEEPRRRGRHGLVGLPAASDLQGRDPVAVRLQRLRSSCRTAWRRASGR